MYTLHPYNNNRYTYCELWNELCGSYFLRNYSYMCCTGCLTNLHSYYSVLKLDFIKVDYNKLSSILKNGLSKLRFCFIFNKLNQQVDIMVNLLKLK